VFSAAIPGFFSDTPVHVKVCLLEVRVENASNGSVRNSGHRIYFLHSYASIAQAQTLRKGRSWRLIVGRSEYPVVFSVLFSLRSFLSKL